MSASNILDSCFYDRLRHIFINPLPFLLASLILSATLHNSNAQTTGIDVSEVLINDEVILTKGGLKPSFNRAANPSVKSSFNRAAKAPKSGIRRGAIKSRNTLRTKFSRSSKSRATRSRVTPKLSRTKISRAKMRSASSNRRVSAPRVLTSKLRGAKKPNTGSFARGGLSKGPVPGYLAKKVNRSTLAAPNVRDAFRRAASPDSGKGAGKPETPTNPTLKPDGPKL